MLETTKDRILGCLKGVAIGDAVGKQTENVGFDEIKTCVKHVKKPLVKVK